MFTGIAKPMLDSIAMVAALPGCNVVTPSGPAACDKYQIVSAGTRQFEWDTVHGTARIKALIERENLGSGRAEMAEIWFPPAYPCPGTGCHPGETYR
jgi:hypothetical protein